MIIGFPGPQVAGSMNHPYKLSAQEELSPLSRRGVRDLNKISRSLLYGDGVVIQIRNEFFLSVRFSFLVCSLADAILAENKRS
jgi:hypothetical protein